MVVSIFTLGDLMGTIKLYQFHDLIAGYLKGWGYDDPLLTDRLLRNFPKDKKNPQIDDLFCFFDSVLNEKINLILPNVQLENEQKKAYFKMVFLMGKAYRKCSLFEPLTQDEINYLKSLFRDDCLKATPSLTHSDMIKQRIVVYHPWRRARKYISRFFNKVKNFIFFVKR